MRERGSKTGRERQGPLVLDVGTSECKTWPNRSLVKCQQPLPSVPPPTGSFKEVGPCSPPWHLQLLSSLHPPTPRHQPPSPPSHPLNVLFLQARLLETQKCFRLLIKNKKRRQNQLSPWSPCRTRTRERLSNGPLPLKLVITLGFQR